MNDHEARKKQLADMQEKSKTKHRSMPQELFFDVFCNPDKYPMGESSNTVGRHLECIDQVMGEFWTISLTRTQPNAIQPTQAHASDAGWDLYSCEPRTILPSERAIINTGISLAIPKSFVGLIWPRSGMAVKQGIDVLAGVIDSGYRGEVKVCLLNTGNMPVIIEAGDRIAQILFQEVPKFKLVETKDLNETDRNSGGFGSSGS
jgi:dUTP pyrophosphatase